MPTPQPSPRGAHAAHATNAIVDKQTSRSNIKGVKAATIMIALFIGLVLIAYAGVGLYLNGRFMPNTTAAHIDFSLMTKSEAETLLQSRLDAYTLTLEGDGFKTQLAANDIGLTLDTNSAVNSMLATANPWLWPFQVFIDHDLTEQLLGGASGATLGDAVRARVDEFNQSAVQPKDATIVYHETSESFSIQPETIGTALDPDAVTNVAEEAVSKLARKATLDENQLKQPHLFQNDPKLENALAQANTMASASLSLTMKNYPLAQLDGATIAPWITTDAEGNATLDDTKVAKWVAEVAQKSNTVGSTRSFTNPSGKEVSVSGGVYGWTINQEELVATVKTAILQGSSQTIEVPTTTHGETYSGPGKPDWGPRYMDVDLTQQHARFYDESGSLIWESDVITGKPDGEHDTPTGVYWMNAKASPSTLMGYNGNEKIYETKVQYWMPFVGNAIGFHDADWQTSGFGGTLYAEGLGSHGCVNLPPAQAAELYGLISEGDAVVVHL